MSQTCFHLGIHNQHVSNGTCCATLDIAYQCVASGVLKIPNVKNFAIVMATNKQTMLDYLPNLPTNGEGHQLEGTSLTTNMEKFTILASLKSTTLF